MEKKKEKKKVEKKAIIFNAEDIDFPLVKFKPISMSKEDLKSIQK